MSFFAKLFGGTFETNRDEGEAHFAAGHWGEARIAYGRALDKAKDASVDEKEKLRARIHACKLALAKIRLEDADSYTEAGRLEEAAEVLDDVLEISSAPELRAVVEERRKHLQVLHQRHLLGAAEEMSEEDVLAVIAGTWTEAQAMEMAEAPEEVHRALLLAHDGHHEQAAELLAQVVTRGDLSRTPCYLQWELANRYISAGNLPQATESLALFLEACTAAEPEDLKLRVTAHLLRARLLAKLERYDDVQEHWQQAKRLLPGSHEVFLSVGVMQRERGDFDASLASLEKARELMGQLKPDISVIREMGLTYIAKGDRRSAKETFESIIEHFASKGDHEMIDPRSALVLAKLHEEDGDLLRAADLVRHLAAGHDIDNHFQYNLEAARLLRRGGADEQVVAPYLERATLLAETEEGKALLDALRDG